MLKEIVISLGLSKRERTPEDVNRNLMRIELAREFATKSRSQELSFDIQKIFIFGSVARKEDKETSDVDLAIILDSNVYQLNSYKESQISEELHKIAGELAHLRFGNFQVLPIHLTILTAKRFELDKYTSGVILNIHNEGVEL